MDIELLHVMPRIHRALQIDSSKRILTRHPGWNPSELLAMVGLTLKDVIFFPQDGPDGGYVQVKLGSVISHACTPRKRRDFSAWSGSVRRYVIRIPFPCGQNPESCWPADSMSRGQLAMSPSIAMVSKPRGT